MRFVHDTLPQRVCFGSGEAAANLEREIAEPRRQPGHADRVQAARWTPADTLTGNLPRRCSGTTTW